MRLEWDKPGEHLYETGVRNCVLYPQVNSAYNHGYAWNGITAINETPSGADANPLYADDTKYLNLIANEDFGGTVEAYIYPDEFAECDGSASLASGIVIGQQARKPFGLCYRTTLGNDSQGTDYGYKLHLVYGATASPSEKAYATINDSPEAITFSWEFNTVPVTVTGFRPVSHLEIDSTKVDPDKLATLEDILYGTAGTDPRLPLPDEIAELVGEDDVFPVSNYLVGVNTDNESATAEGTYNETLTAQAGKSIVNVIVLMGGTDITSTAYTSATHKVSISSVTGPIVVYATAN